MCLNFALLKCQEKNLLKKERKLSRTKMRGRCVVSHIAELRARHVTSLVIATAE